MGRMSLIRYSMAILRLQMRGPPVNATLAGVFQDYLTGFAARETPNADALPWFPVYGKNEPVKVVAYSDFSVIEVDPMANQRCAYWQSAPYA